MKMGNLEKRSSTDWSECGELPSMPKDAPQRGRHYQQSLCFFFVTAVLAPSGTLVYERNHRAPLTWKLAERGL